MKATRMVLLSGLAAFALACASYRYLAPQASADGVPFPFRYQSTHLFLFSSEGDDSAPERLFLDPRAGGSLLATVLRPDPGVVAIAPFSSAGEGIFSSLPFDPEMSPRMFREVLFDPKDPQQIYARTFQGVVASRDGGRSWRRLSFGDNKKSPALAIALGPGGTLYVAQGHLLFASDDRGQSFRQLMIAIPTVEAPINHGPLIGGDAPRPDPVRIRSVLPDATDAQTIFVSLEPEPPVEIFQRRLTGLLEGTTDEGRAARKIAGASDETPFAQLAFGDGRAGVYVTHDGGASFQKTGLAIDAWLTEREGAIYAVLAEPLITAAGLVARNPELAVDIRAQLHQNGFDFESLRRVCAYPGRDPLLFALPPAPILRSTDRGATWSRVVHLDIPFALSLRRSLESQASGRDPWPPRPAPPKRPPPGATFSHDFNPADKIGPDDMRNRPVRRDGLSPTDPFDDDLPLPQDVTLPLLSLLDPASLLAHVAFEKSLTGIAFAGRGGNGGDDGLGVLYAYAPTAQYWEQLAGALVHQSKLAGELSLQSATGLSLDIPAFELLRSDDSGRTWTPLPTQLDRYGILNARGIVPYPESIAANSELALVLLSGRDRDGHGFHQLLRESAPATRVK